jgi:hypothetical protein
VSERIAEELALLRTVYPDVEQHGDGDWVRIPSYPLDEAVWGLTSCEVAFKIPILGQPPYGFSVRPGLSVPGGAAPQNYTFPTDNPFGTGWGQFSWAAEAWEPRATVARGANMLRWAESFAQRLAEGT